MYRPTLAVILLSFTFYHNVEAFNILAVISLPLRSHYMAFQTLFQELAIRGHSVTVINNYPDENSPRNLTFIELPRNNKTNNIESFTPVNRYEKFHSSLIHLYNFYRHYELAPQATKQDCENLLNGEKVKAHYAKGNKYDVIFVEQFFGDCALAYASYMYDAPIIGITSHVMLPLSYSRLGIPFDFSADSFYFSKGGTNPTLYHKIESIVLNFLYNKVGNWFVQSYIHEVFNHYLPGNSLDIEKAARERIKMLFVYQHFSLTGARLLPPQVLEIGGIHIRKPKPVSEAIEKFLSSAEHGVVYVSFGSNLKASTMSDGKMQEFLKAFKSIPQKVIWKYEGPSLTQGYENVYHASWLPQLDVLCHPKVVAFVMQGGMLSMSEAAHCGKPVLVVPFFGDQFTNAAAASSVGLGKTLYLDQITADTLVKRIQELTSDEMQQTAKRVSKLWHDRPLSVMDSAIYWTEYVARHGTSPPPLPSQRSTWFEAMLLDVIAAFVVLFMLIYIIFKTIFMFILKVLGKLTSKKKEKVL